MEKRTSLSFCQKGKNLSHIPSLSLSLSFSLFLSLSLSHTLRVYLTLSNTNTSLERQRQSLLPIHAFILTAAVFSSNAKKLPSRSKTLLQIKSLALERVGVFVAQWKHSCFPPSSPGFKSWLCEAFFLAIALFMDSIEFEPI